MSLRERQKTDRRRRILDAALGLFLAQGYSQTRIEDIAENCELSVATTYNYFPSKGEILLALLTIENRQIYDRIAEMDLERLPTAAEAYERLFNAYFDPSISILNPDAWRHGFALSFASVSTPGAAELREIDGKLSNQVVSLTRALQLRGALSRQINPDAFGRILFNNANMLFFEFNRAEQMSLEDMRCEVRKLTVELIALATPGGA